MKLTVGFTQFTLAIEAQDELDVLLLALRQFDAQNGANPCSQAAREMYETIERLRAKAQELRQTF